MKTKTCTTCSKNKRPAFSLAETVTVLVITALILIAVINIYNRVKTAAASVTTMFEKNDLPNEILQRLAEDPQLHRDGE